MLIRRCHAVLNVIKQKKWAGKSAQVCQLVFVQNPYGPPQNHSAAKLVIRQGTFGSSYGAHLLLCSERRDCSLPSPYRQYPGVARWQDMRESKA
jgi:hypothetical protein